MTTAEQPTETTTERRQHIAQDGEVVDQPRAVEPEPEPETLAEKRRRLKAEREAEAAAQAPETPADGVEGNEPTEPPDDFEDGPNQTTPTPEDGEQEPPAMPVGGGRSSAGADPQLQMDEIVLDAEENLPLLANLEMMERWHAAKLSFDKAHREAVNSFHDLGMFDGNAHAYRLRDFRIVQLEPKGEAKSISFIREPTQKIQITRD